jgi:hypothetical protein
MFEIKQKKSKDNGPYTHDVYFNGKLLSDSAYRDEGILVMDKDAGLNKAELFNLPIKSYPNNFRFWLFDFNETYKSFSFTSLKKIKNKVVIEFEVDEGYFESTWSMPTYFTAMGDISLQFPEFSKMELSEGGPNGYFFTMLYQDSGEGKIKNCFERSKKQLIKLCKATELSLANFKWKKQYENNESLFTIEILLSLLRKMKFLSIRYNHGTREYGKDITFSELDKFGLIKNYGVQVKAGNISGSVNSQVDEIIGQINDAFKMPYYTVESRSPKYISFFIIIISGKFTDNAKEKIMEKIDPSILGTIYFFDKEKIIELVEKYWK